MDFWIASWQNERSFGIRDAYKWLFQATMGGEHAISSLDGVRRWMDREWDGLGPPLANEPLTTTLSPDGSLLRVNLRPFKASGGDKDILLSAFVASAQQFRPDKSEFLVQWRQLGDFLKREPIMEMNHPAWLEVDALMSPEYGAIDHSSEYITTNHPAYRVLLRSLYPGS